MLGWLKGIFVFGFICVSIAVAGDDDDIEQSVDVGRSCTSSEGSAYVPSGSSLDLFRLVNEHHIEGIRAEVAAGADVDFMLGSIRRAPLHAAARLGDVEVVRVLLELGAEVEIVDCNGKTPLDLAEEKGHQDVVDLLRGVEVPEVSAMTCTVAEQEQVQEGLIFVMPQEVLEIVFAQLSSGDLARLARVCRQMRNAVLVENVVGISDVRGALSIAINGVYVSRLEGSREERAYALLRVCDPVTRPVGVDWMLRRGVDVLAFFDLALDEESQSTAFLGDEEGEPTVPSRRIFINEIFDAKGRAPLHVAAEAGDARIVALLLQHGADVNVREMDAHNEREQLCTAIVPGGLRWRNYTPLMIAVIGGHLDVVRLLLNQGALPDLEDIYGNTAICFAVFDGNEAMVDLLIEHGANINVVNGLGETLERVAAGHGYERILNRLQTTAYQDNLERIPFSFDDDEATEPAVDYGADPDLGNVWASLDDDGKGMSFWQ